MTLPLALAAAPTNHDTPPPALPTRYRVTIDDYRAFRRDGFLVVRGLVAPAEIAELRQHTEDLMRGRLPGAPHRERRR